MYAIDLNEPKYEILIKKRKDAGIKHLNDPNAFSECSNMMDDVYKNINDCNSNRKRKILSIFDDMIADIMANTRFQHRIKELFIRCRKLKLNSTHYLIMKINNKRELQNIAINHSADIYYKDFLKIYRKCAKEPFNFLTIDTTLPASNPLRSRKN